MSAVRYDGPAGLRTRGTVLVIPGRGESQATYNRLASRLAADSYHVRVLPPPALDADDVAGSLDSYAAVVTSEVDAETVHPLVLIGSDTGALVAAGILPIVEAADVLPAAVVLAGIPGRGRSQQSAWQDELVVRTQCHVHQGVLTDDPTVVRGALATAAPTELFDQAEKESSAAHHVVLHGDEDPLAEYEEVAQFVKGKPSAQLAVVVGAHHDVLNDIYHRAVAAAVVTFFERLRGGPSLDPIVRVEYSSWTAG
jgi:alpha-beta hydrolase superfamily lysophospholipase